MTCGNSTRSVRRVHGGVKFLFFCWVYVVYLHGVLLTDTHSDVHYFFLFHCRGTVQALLTNKPHLQLQPRSCPWSFAAPATRTSSRESQALGPLHLWFCQPKRSELSPTCLGSCPRTRRRRVPPKRVPITSCMVSNGCFQGVWFFFFCVFLVGSLEVG